ncbi:MAG: hypothetical protein NTU53_04680 [Planctomycetota bacterium]|nr:hypothetical protein [Planctomycetota bacterium]
MSGGFWEWVIRSDAGLAVRVGVGVSILGVLAVAEIRRRGREARRWREYLFLLFAAGVAMAYGVVNDLITAGISWEYYYYGKGLDVVLGATVPPAVGALRWEAAVVGMKSTWTAGLIGGVALLIANNPRKGREQLPYGALCGLVPMMVAWAGLWAAVLGVVGYMGFLARFSGDFAELVREDLFRPRRFMCVYGIHLGGYVGGLIGAIAGVVWIVRKRGGGKGIASCGRG